MRDIYVRTKPGQPFAFGMMINFNPKEQIGYVRWQLHTGESIRTPLADLQMISHAEGLLVENLLSAKIESLASEVQVMLGDKP